MEDMTKLEGQTCPVCGNKTLTLMEMEREIPYFGLAYFFNMECSSCDYSKADVEAADQHEPTKHTVEISGEEDLSIRIVKSSTATVKIPKIMTIEPGPASNGYVTNIEGILRRVKNQLEAVRDDEEDKDKRTKARNMIKKLNKVMWGDEKLKIILEDPNGNSAIISEKVKVAKLR